MSNFDNSNAMKETEKIKYVLPTVEVNPVVLDASIAVQSPIGKIEVEDWVEEDLAPDTGDIFIAI